MEDKSKIDPVKKTFGEQYLEGIKKDSGKAPVKEIRDGLLSEWDQNMFELIAKTRAVIPNKKFYIKVTTKREQLVRNTLRNYFESCYACPTPQFEQVVYRVEANGTDVSLLWTIPNKEACIYLKRNKDVLPESEHELLNWVLDFDRGKLDQYAQKENGEIVQKL
jgi:hypothetical protein